MPFKKVGKNRYRSPSGRTYTRRQVRAYYATKGFKRAPRGGRRRGRRRRRRRTRSRRRRH